jgi:hypothetical protein
MGVGVGVGGAHSRAGSPATRFCDALKISPHWPHRTQPSEMRSWSGTTLNIVWHAGHRVIRLIAVRL